MKKDKIKDVEGNKVKFKALDVVIILLILVSLVGVYFRYNILDMLTGARNLNDYTVSFKITDIRYTTEGHINVGDKVYFYSDGEELGTIIEASEDSNNALIVVPTQIIYTPEDKSQTVSVSYPANTRIDASGRMLCKCAKSDDGYYLVSGTRYIAPGDKISVKTEKVTVEITIIGIEAEIT